VRQARGPEQRDQVFAAAVDATGDAQEQVDDHVQFPRLGVRVERQRAEAVAVEGHDEAVFAGPRDHHRVPVAVNLVRGELQP
jgi:hypothetical protein